MSESDRPSRQELVVPPRQSSWPMIVGACACACAGFGVVWGLGIGRSRPQGDEPAAFSQADAATAQALPADGWRAPEPTAAPVADRYAQPVSLDHVDTGSVVPAAAESRSLSRFSAPPAEPADPVAPVAESAAETEHQPLADDAADPEATPPTRDPPAATPGAAVPAPLAETDADAEVETKAEPTELTATADEPADEPVTPAPVPAAPPMQQPPAPPAAPITPNPPAAPLPFSPPPQPFSPSPAAVPPAAPPAPVSGVAAPPLAPPPAAFGATPPQLTAATMTHPPAAAFGSPPLSGPLPPAPPTAAHGGATGQGRPGAMQLEGVQTPQVTVEKRGPREVQVGKPARYEIVLRNVGGAIAHDVVLRDAIPAGSSLITTTPPASPASSNAGAAGELVWMLGTLGPGNETKVAMEVMPEAEGEIGSVASVTFRADASIRSRATKPALQLDAETPAAVLIGKPINLAIKVSNPGTGVATGVVLEGVLPEGVTHRAGRELEFDVGQLRPGEVRTIDLSLATSGPGVHAMKVVARADGRLEVEQAVPLEVTAPTLEIAAEMPARRYLQRPATCRITMANTGTAPAKSVELATQLPPGMKFVRANNAGYYDERNHRVLWSLEELPAGDTGTVEVVVMPISLGPQKFMTAARNPDGLSDQIASTIEVEGLAALSFEVTDSEDPIEVDGQTEYVIRVGNQGTKAASGVRLSATLLGEMEPLDAKGPAAHRVENLTVLFEPLARLAPSEEAVFRVRVRGRREGDQRVQVQITSDDHPAPITKEEITRVYADR